MRKQRLGGSWIPLSLHPPRPLETLFILCLGLLSNATFPPSPKATSIVFPLQAPAGGSRDPVLPGGLAAIAHQAWLSPKEPPMKPGTQRDHPPSSPPPKSARAQPKVRSRPPAPSRSLPLPPADTLRRPSRTCAGPSQHSPSTMLAAASPAASPAGRTDNAGGMMMIVHAEQPTRSEGSRSARRRS